MAKGAVQVEGVRQLRAALTALGVEAQDFKDIHRQVSDLIGPRAAQKAPRQSGMLAASWRPGSAKTQATVRFGGSRVPYANAVHWGTGPRSGLRGPHNIRRNAFAWNAAQETQPEWLDWYLGQLEHLTNKAMEAAS